ncbi:MAG: hypothetical protein AB1782_17610 [Cyanobacteriota bacterium]
MNTSAEDRLLRLIKNNKNITEDSNLSNQHLVKNNNLIKKFSLNLVAFNRFLTYILLVFIVLFLCNLIFTKPRSIDFAKQKSNSKNLVLEDKETPEFNYYLTSFNKNIFSDTSSTGENYYRDINTIGDIDPADILKDINLLGIVSGEKPQAIIEDKKTQKTYFLNKGDSFGQVKVLEIKEGKVLLDYRGKNFDLFL